jgi:WD40 repeat protein
MIVLTIGWCGSLTSLATSVTQTAYLIEVTRYDDGSVTGVHWLTPDTIAVSTHTGLWLYNATDLTQPPEFLDDHRRLAPTTTQADQHLYFWNFDHGRARLNWRYPIFSFNSTWIQSESLQAAAHDSFGNALIYRFGQRSVQVRALPILPSNDYQNASIDLALSPTGEQLAVASYEYLCMEGAYTQLALWDLDTSTASIDVSTSLEKAVRFRDIQFTSDGTGFGVIGEAAESAQVRLWELKSGEAVELPALGEFERSIGFRWVPDRDHVVIFGSTDASIRIFDANARTLTHTIPALDGTITSLDFSPDGSKLVITRTGVDPNTLQIGDYVENDGVIRYQNPLTLEGRHHAFSPTFTTLATSNDRDLQLWDMDGTPIAEVALPIMMTPPIMEDLMFVPMPSIPHGIAVEIPQPYELGGVRTSPDGTRTALILNSGLGCPESQDHRIALWQGDQMLWEVETAIGDRLIDVLFTPDSAWMIAIHERSVVLLDAATGDRLASFEAPILTAHLDTTGRFLRLNTPQGETILLTVIRS